MCSSRLIISMLHKHACIGEQREQLCSHAWLFPYTWRIKHISHEGADQGRLCGPVPKHICFDFAQCKQLTYWHLYYSRRAVIGFSSKLFTFSVLHDSKKHLTSVPTNTESNDSAQTRCLKRHRYLIMALESFVCLSFLSDYVSPSLLCTGLFAVPVIPPSPFYPSPQCETIGHIPVSTHLLNKHILWAKGWIVRWCTVCVREGECVSRQLRWISVLISLSVRGQSYYCKEGQKGHFATSPLFSFHLPTPPIILCLPLSPSLRRQINHPSIVSWNFFFPRLFLI